MNGNGWNVIKYTSRRWNMLEYYGLCYNQLEQAGMGWIWKKYDDNDRKEDDDKDESYGITVHALQL